MTPDLATLAAALAATLAGIAAGWFHFASLARVADLLVAGRVAGVGLQLGRFAVLAVFFWLCARAGWPMLLAGAAGVLIGRALVLRRLG